MIKNNHSRNVRILKDRQMLTVDENSLNNNSQTNRPSIPDSYTTIREKEERKQNLLKLKTYTKKKIFPKLKAIISPEKKTNQFETYSNIEDYSKDFKEIILNEKIELVKTTLNIPQTSREFATEPNKKNHLPRISGGKINLAELYEKDTEEEHCKTAKYDIVITEKNGEPIYKYVKIDKTRNKVDSNENTPMIRAKLPILSPSPLLNKKLLITQKKKLNIDTSQLPLKSFRNISRKNKPTSYPKLSCYFDKSPFFHNRDISPQKDKLVNKIEHTKDNLLSLSSKLTKTLSRMLKEVRSEYNL